MNQPRRIKALLIDQDGKLKDSAQALQMRPDRLSRIVNGKALPSEIELLRMANHLGCQIEDLFPQP